MNPRHATALALIGLSLLLLSAACSGGAAIDERRAKPLQLRSIDFFNTQTGDPLSGRTDSFDVANVLYVGWEVSFENRLYKLESSQYRVDAVYIGPDGRTLGSINDFRDVSPSMKTVTFSGRVGNSRGGAFLPGTYTVKFYLNGEYFNARKFEVLATAQRLVPPLVRFRPCWSALVRPRLSRPGPG